LNRIYKRIARNAKRMESG